MRAKKKKFQTKVVQGQMKYILCWTHYSISCTSFGILEQELLWHAYIYKPVYSTVSISL